MFNIFNFRKKILNPALAAIIGKMNQTLKLDNAAEKAERLLALKEESNSTLKKIITDQESNGNSLLLVGGLAVGVLVAAHIAPVLAIFATIGLFGALMKNMVDKGRADTDKEIVAHAINQEVATLIDTHPHEVLNSPRFKQGIKAAFNTLNPGHEAAQTSIAQLAARVTPKV
jgi:hypothetical protein